MSLVADTATGLAAVRDLEFPGLAGCTFLNAASFGPLPRRTRLAVTELLRVRAEEPHRFAGFDLAPVTARCRASVAALIGARPDEIALGPGTSFGLYLAATLFPQWCRRVGRRIEDATVLVSDREFPANVQPWLGLRRRGARVEILPADPDGFPREDAMLARLDRGDVALLAVSAVQFATGYRADLERLGTAARDAGTLFVVDGAQAVGAAPLDVERAHVDVLACGGQKWLCAPHGSGFAYVRRDLCAMLEPPLRGWLAVEMDEDFGRLLDYDAPLLDDARRFEIGSPIVHDLLGLTESAGLLAEVGVTRIAAHIDDVLSPLRAWIDTTPAARPGSPLYGTHASAIVCVAVPNAATAYRGLADAHVVCALREGLLRFSPHLYNTKEEMQEVVQLLDRFA